VSDVATSSLASHVVPACGSSAQRTGFFTGSTKASVARNIVVQTHLTDGQGCLVAQTTQTQAVPT
jgi:hypothetical protein